MRNNKKNRVEKWIFGVLLCSMVLCLSCPISAKAAAKDYWMLVQGGDYRNEAEAILGTVNTVTIKGNKMTLKGKNMNTFKTKDFGNTEELGKSNKKTITLSKSCKYYISEYDENGEDTQKKVSLSKFKKALKAGRSKAKPHAGKNQPDGFLMVHVKKNKAVEVGSICQFQ